MDQDKQIERQVDLLLHESSQLHENIQRNLNEMNKLLALAFPALTAALALVLEGKLVKEGAPIYPLFCLLASLLVVVFNNVWMQLLGFTRYKYAEVLPRLYLLIVDCPTRRQFRSVRPFEAA